jgi:hypothetical protein
VERDVGDGTAALPPLLALAERRSRAKWSVQNGERGVRLGLKADARAGTTGRHPAEGVAGVRPRDEEALLSVGHGEHRRDAGTGRAGFGRGPRSGAAGR